MFDPIELLPDSPALQLLRSADVLPSDALQLAADCVATEIVRGTPGARELSDWFAAARIPLPLLNWPRPVVESLDRAGSRVLSAVSR